MTYKYALEAELRKREPKDKRAAEGVIRKFDRDLEAEPREADPLERIREEIQRFQGVEGFTVGGFPGA